MAVIQIQIVEQAHAGGHPVIAAPAAGQPEGDIGYEQRVVIGGDGKVVPPLPHGGHLAGGQQILDTIEVRSLVDAVLWNGHRRF